MADIAKELQKLKALVNQRQTTAIFSNKSNESTKLALGDAELYINDMTRKFSFTRAGVKNPVMIDPKTKAVENVEYLNGMEVEKITGLYDDVEQLKYDMEHHKHELMDYDVKITESLAVGGTVDISVNFLDTARVDYYWTKYARKLTISIQPTVLITTEHVFRFNISFELYGAMQTISCEHDFTQYATIPKAYIDLNCQSTVSIQSALMTCSSVYMIYIQFNIPEEDIGKISHFTINELAAVGKVKAIPPTTISKTGDVNIPGTLTVQSNNYTGLNVFGEQDNVNMFFGKSAAEGEGVFASYVANDNSFGFGFNGDVGTVAVIRPEKTFITNNVAIDGDLTVGGMEASEYDLSPNVQSVGWTADGWIEMSFSSFIEFNGEHRLRCCLANDLETYTYTWDFALWADEEGKLPDKMTNVTDEGNADLMLEACGNRLYKLVIWPRNSEVQGHDNTVNELMLIGQFKLQPTTITKAGDVSILTY